MTMKKALVINVAKSNDIIDKMEVSVLFDNKVLYIYNLNIPIADKVMQLYLHGAPYKAWATIKSNTKGYVKKVNIKTEV